RRHTRSKRDWSSDVCSSDLLFTRLLGKSVVWRKCIPDPCATSECGCFPKSFVLSKNAIIMFFVRLIILPVDKLEVVRCLLDDLFWKNGVLAVSITCFGCQFQKHVTPHFRL